MLIKQIIVALNKMD